MIDFELFQKRLEQVKEDYRRIDEKIDDLINGLSSFIEDCGGVAQSWLVNLVINHFETLFLSVSEKISPDDLDDIISYYIFEREFGGEISWEENGQSFSFNLKNDKDLYNYLIYLGNSNGESN